MAQLGEAGVSVGPKQRQRHYGNQRKLRQAEFRVSSFEFQVMESVLTCFSTHNRSIWQLAPMLSFRSVVLATTKQTRMIAVSISATSPVFLFPCRSLGEASIYKKPKCQCTQSNCGGKPKQKPAKRQKRLADAIAHPKTIRAVAISSLRSREKSNPWQQEEGCQSLGTL
jgi:hypothetical protein